MLAIVRNVNGASIKSPHLKWIRRGFNPKTSSEIIRVGCKKCRKCYKRSTRASNKPSDWSAQALIDSFCLVGGLGALLIIFSEKQIITAIQLHQNLLFKPARAFPFCPRLFYSSMFSIEPYVVQSAFPSIPKTKNSAVVNSSLEEIALRLESSIRKRFDDHPPVSSA